MFSLRDAAVNSGGGGEEEDDDWAQLRETAGKFRKQKLERARKDPNGEGFFYEPSVTKEEETQYSQDAVAFYSGKSHCSSSSDAFSSPQLSLSEAALQELSFCATMMSLVHISFPRVWVMPPRTVPRSYYMKECYDDVLAAASDPLTSVSGGGPTTMRNANIDYSHKRCLVAIKREALREVPPRVGSSGDPMSVKYQKVLARWPGGGKAMNPRLAAVLRSVDIEDAKRERWNQHIKMLLQHDQGCDTTITTMTDEDTPCSLRSATLPSTTPSRSPATDALSLGGDSAVGGSVAVASSTISGETLYWPAYLTRIVGVLEGEIFEDSFRGLGKLQLYDTFEEVIVLALQAPLHLFADVMFALDETSEQHRLRLAPHVEYPKDGSTITAASPSSTPRATLEMRHNDKDDVDDKVRLVGAEAYQNTDPLEASAWVDKIRSEHDCPLLLPQSLPDVISICNYSYDPAPASAASSSSPSMASTAATMTVSAVSTGSTSPPSTAKAKLHRSTLSNNPISVFSMFAGPVCQTGTAVFLRPTPQVVAQAQRQAIAHLYKSWCGLRQALLDRLVVYEEQAPFLPPPFSSGSPALTRAALVETETFPVFVDSCAEEGRGVLLPNPETYESPYILTDLSRSDALPAEPTAQESMTEAELAAATRLPQLQSHSKRLYASPRAGAETSSPTVTPMFEKISRFDKSASARMSPPSAARPRSRSSTRHDDQHDDDCARSHPLCPPPSALSRPVMAQISSSPRRPPQQHSSELSVSGSSSNVYSSLRMPFLHNSTGCTMDSSALSDRGSTLSALEEAAHRRREVQSRMQKMYEDEDKAHRSSGRTTRLDTSEDSIITPSRHSPEATGKRPAASAASSSPRSSTEPPGLLPKVAYPATAAAGFPRSGTGKCKSVNLSNSSTSNGNGDHSSEHACGYVRVGSYKGPMLSTAANSMTSPPPVSTAFSCSVSSNNKNDKNAAASSSMFSPLPHVTSAATVNHDVSPTSTKMEDNSISQVVPLRQRQHYGSSADDDDEDDHCGVACCEAPHGMLVSVVTAAAVEEVGSGISTTVRGGDQEEGSDAPRSSLCNTIPFPQSATATPAPVLTSRRGAGHSHTVSDEKSNHAGVDTTPPPTRSVDLVQENSPPPRPPVPQATTTTTSAFPTAPSSCPDVAQPLSSPALMPGGPVAVAAATLLPQSRSSQLKLRHVFLPSTAAVETSVLTPPQPSASLSEAFNSNNNNNIISNSSSGPGERSPRTTSLSSKSEPDMGDKKKGADANSMKSAAAALALEYHSVPTTAEQSRNNDDDRNENSYSNNSSNIVSGPSTRRRLSLHRYSSTQEQSASRLFGNSSSRSNHAQVSQHNNRPRSIDMSALDDDCVASLAEVSSVSPSTIGAAPSLCTSALSAFKVVSDKKRSNASDTSGRRPHDAQMSPLAPSSATPVSPPSALAPTAAATPKAASPTSTAKEMRGKAGQVDRVAPQSLKTSAASPPPRTATLQQSSESLHSGSQKRSSSRPTHDTEESHSPPTSALAPTVTRHTTDKSTPSKQKVSMSGLLESPASPETPLKVLHTPPPQSPPSPPALKSQQDRRAVGSSRTKGGRKEAAPATTTSSSSVADSRSRETRSSLLLHLVPHTRGVAPEEEYPRSSNSNSNSHRCPAMDLESPQRYKMEEGKRTKRKVRKTDGSGIEEEQQRSKSSPSTSLSYRHRSHPRSTSRSSRHHHNRSHSHSHSTRNATPREPFNDSRRYSSPTLASYRPEAMQDSNSGNPPPATTTTVAAVTPYAPPSSTASPTMKRDGHRGRSGHRTHEKGFRTSSPALPPSPLTPPLHRHPSSHCGDGSGSARRPRSSHAATEYHSSDEGTSSLYGEGGGGTAGTRHRRHHHHHNSHRSGHADRSARRSHSEEQQWTAPKANDCAAHTSRFDNETSASSSESIPVVNRTNPINAREATSRVVHKKCFHFL